MTLLLFVLALAAGEPFLFKHMQRQSVQHRSLSTAWIVAMAVCVVIPVLIVALNWRATAVSHVDVPLPVLVLLPIAWGIWLLLQRQTRSKWRPT